MSIFKKYSSEKSEDVEHVNSDVEQSFNTEEMLHTGSGVGLAAYQGGKSDFSFTDGKNQIDFSGKVIESSYEFFVGAESVYENGELLYDRDATCVDNYHNETYIRGRFDSMSDVVAYLGEKYPDTAWQSTSNPYPKVDKVYDYRWENKAYAAEQEAKKNHTYLDRVVFADKGIFTNKDGRKYHAVDFAYACDQKGDNDKPIANPYLMSAKKKDLDGTSRIVHTYYLSDDIYYRLNAYANKDGIGDTSRWSGVINAKVSYPTIRNGKSKRSVDLTTAALNRGEIERPDVPFDEEKHNRFVKKSLAVVRQQRAEKAAEISDSIEVSSGEKNMEAEA